MLDNLFGDSVDEFLGKTDEMIDKIEDWKDKKVGYFASDEKEPVVVMGNSGEVEDIKNDI